MDINLNRLFLLSSNLARYILILLVSFTYFADELKAGTTPTEDTTPPELTGLTINTPVFDTTSGPANVNFTLTATDDISRPLQK